MSNSITPVTIRIADFSLTKDAQAFVQLMQEYAQDPMGGGEPIADTLLASLPQTLKTYPGAFSVIAWQGDRPIGLTNCFETLSTFKALPLINVHDLVVSSQSRGLGIAPKMLAKVEQVARERGCCKLTLEVLEGNERARQVYLEFGFKGYELDEAFGSAQFWEKPLNRA
ncbi:MAG: GNAT family N-acetyltransferase [Cellvibrionaceae bacterium]